MNDEQKIGDWCRWYLAAQPSYKAEALRAVYVNDRALFGQVVDKLKLTLADLMLHMADDPSDIQMQRKERRRAK